jgi:hypothetical protein
VSEGDRQKYTKNYSTELEKNKKVKKTNQKNMIYIYINIVILKIKKLLEYVQYLKKSNTIQVRKFKKA